MYHGSSTVALAPEFDLALGLDPCGVSVGCFPCWKHAMASERGLELLTRSKRTAWTRGTSTIRPYCGGPTKPADQDHVRSGRKKQALPPGRNKVARICSHCLLLLGRTNGRVRFAWLELRGRIVGKSSDWLALY